MYVTASSIIRCVSTLRNGYIRLRVLLVVIDSLYCYIIDLVIYRCYIGLSIFRESLICLTHELSPKFLDRVCVPSALYAGWAVFANGKGQPPGRFGCWNGGRWDGSSSSRGTGVPLVLIFSGLCLASC